MRQYKYSKITFKNEQMIYKKNYVTYIQYLARAVIEKEIKTKVMN